MIRISCRLTAAWPIVLAACVCASALGCASTIDDDEQLILFPTFAAENGPSTWTADIRGWIYEPEVGEKRQFLLGELERLLRHNFDLRNEDLESAPTTSTPHFSERAALFLVDNERRKRVAVTIAGETFTLGRSEPDGVFAGDVTLTRATSRSGEWTEVRAVTRPEDPRVFAGKLQFIGRRGLSVVSDIDDTIKDSHVLDMHELGVNTFLRDFRAVAGMSDLYRRWAASGTAVFHYVSTSPLQLYPALADFVRRDGFPEGSFHLRPFRLKDRSVQTFFGDPPAFKVGVIDSLMRRFPERRFILVGDSGEQDPEVYQKLASRFPKRVAAILIRDVRGQDLTSPRFVQLYADLPADIERRVFRDPRELEGFQTLDIPLR
ncbi:MAG: App1 family protein [Vicinamibacterales bacterium]